MTALSLIIFALAPVYHLPAPTLDIHPSCNPGCGRIHLMDANGRGHVPGVSPGPSPLTRDRRHCPRLRVVPGGKGRQEAHCGVASWEE